MLTLLQEIFQGEVYPVHRLDQPVSGLMVYARTKEAASDLSEQMRTGRFQKEYLCIAEGILPHEGEMTDLLFKDAKTGKTYPVKRERKGVREAKLLYKTLSTDETASLCAVTLLTGRSHQIRAQFAARKHPLLGDGRYGSRHNCPLALFSCSLAFYHPETGEKLHFSQPAPALTPWQKFSQQK